MALKGCHNVEIPVIDSLSKEDFDSNYFKKGTPVIIRNSIDGWPAKQWDLHSLQAKLGQTPIHVRTNTNCMQYRTGQKYNIRQTTFHDYINDIHANNKRAQSSYMAVQNIKKALPDLEADIRIPEYVGKVHGGPFLWIANQKHYEFNHFDPDDGLLIIIKGEKRVRLFGCKDLPHLYPNALGTKGRTVQSRVNLEEGEVDSTDEFPKFRNATCHHGLLTDADMLYIPAFWFHQVTTTRTTISLNIFWGDAGCNNYISKVLRPPTRQCFHYWLLNIIQQNRSHSSFPRILHHLHRSLPNFLMTQWHESLTASQVDILVRLVRKYLWISPTWDGQQGGGMDSAKNWYSSNEDGDDDGTKNGGSVNKDGGCGVKVTDVLQRLDDVDDLFRLLKGFEENDVEMQETSKGGGSAEDNEGAVGEVGLKLGGSNAPVLKIRGLLWRN